MMTTLRDIRRRLALAIYPEWIFEGASSQETREMGIFKKNDAKNLLILADFLAAHKGWKITTVGLRFAKSGSFFTRLREGKNFTVSKRDYVIQRFSDHWPSDLEWPSDIPRPKPDQSPDRPVKEQAA